MPDKPKRRKNNKNKRKNKGQNQQNNSTQPGDVSATELVSCDEKVLEIPSQIEKEAVNLNTEFSKTNTEVKCENLVKKLETSREENTEVITTDISSVDTTEKNPTNKGENKYVNNINKQQHVIVVEKYKVESPEKTIRTKLQGTGKSKSVDNDDQPTIVEILDDEKLESCSSAILVDACNVLITEAEPEVQWESTSDLKDMKPMLLETTVPGALSITTIPLITAHCEQTKSMSPEEERTLRKYLQTLNLSTNEASTPKIVEIKTEIEHNEESEIKKRLKNKGVMENIFIPRPGPARSLHVIDEEVSGESSTTSRRHSYLNDKKDETEELEDDVFISSEDVKRKVTFNKDFKTFSNLIPQECYRVGAQIRDPEISEARGAWTTTKLESLTGAEIVYLTDSSSSTSSMYDINENEENNYKSDENVRIITPTIEVINTDNFLKNNYAYNNENCNTDQKLNEDKNTKIKENNFKDNHEISHIKTSREHEIVVLDTDKIETNLYVKEIDNSNLNKNEESKSFVFKDNVHAKKDVNPEKIVDEYDLEIKVLKCELNDAINHLIKEVISDSESANDDVNESLVRQDSSSSIASSQCTAKYNPKCSSLNDISVVESDDFSRTRNEFKQSHDEKSHVMDVIESIKVDSLESNQKIEKISSLRDICLKKISDLPYGEQIIEELAKVSERLQKLSDISTSNTLQYTTSNSKQIRDKNISTLISNVSPPPIKPRNSSLKINREDSRTTLPAQDTSKAYNICLSPSQKMLMEKTKTKLEVVDEKPFIVEQKEKIDVNTQAKDIIKPLDVPFKSQTGSRLLALLQSPSRGHTESKEFNFNKTNKSYETSNNLFSKLNDTNIHDSVNRTFAETPFNGTPRAIDRTNLFKPIPPPKPRNFSSSFNDSHNSSFMDNSFKSIKTENKYFHYSTGNLSKDIEEDISSIQNMHRYYNDIYKQAREDFYPRRPSLPKDLCDQQMEYILQKEKEVEAEIIRLENDRIRTTQRRGPRAPMISDDDIKSRSAFDLNNHINRSYSLINTILQPSSKLETGKLSSVFSKSEEELVRNKMYTEYVSQMAEREQRKQQKVIKITKTPLCLNRNVQSKSESQLKLCEQKVNNRIEKEFIDKARERWNKLGFKDPETEDEKDGDQKYKEPQVIEHKIKVIDSGEEKDVQKLPNHLQDFVKFTVKDKSDKSSSPETVMIAPTFKARSTSPAIWRPGVPSPADAGTRAGEPRPPPPPPPPVWTPSSAAPSPQAPRKAYRPVHFEESPPPRRKFDSTEQNGSSAVEGESRLRTSHSAPVTGLNLLGTTSRLPKAQNPTVTLLQKAREGQLPRAPSYQQERDPRLPRDRPSPPSSDPVHALRRGYVSEGEGEKRERESARKMSDAQKKIDGIGPITKDGMPVALRSEVKDQSRWYKKMYDTIHKNKYDNDYVTIRYKSRRDEPQRVSSSRSQYAYFDPRSGYLSEPEGGLSRLTSWSDAYDSDVTAGTTGPRRRTASVQEERRNDAASPYLSNNKYSTLASTRASQEIHKSQPGKIENYTPGKSSVVDKEAKQQNLSSRTMQLPKEKKDITSSILSKSNMARALKESGYESDSTLIFKRREENEAPLSPAERRAAYRDLQAGGEPPLRGFRSPAPPRTESPNRRYVESDVNIHYRVPVRHDPLPLVPERELARQQAEHMKQLYREQRRNKYLQELQDMQSRRHQDNFMPSQKTIVPLNRYDEAERVVARALYTFNGQTSRELSFKKGDIINVRRQIDNNWYEGDIHGRIGLFPYNYVELLKGETAQSPKKPMVVEGRARAKFDFNAQTNLELPLKKGELVVLTRRIDHNWWEGRIGNKMGIFPDSYVTILQEPSQSKPEAQPILSSAKPAASPAAHGLVNGDKRSLGAHRYTPQPNSPALANAPPATQPLSVSGYSTKRSNNISAPMDRGYSSDLNNTEPLYVDTNAEAVPYRAMYKYRPQNPDELELNEGDTVYVLEKCDDGWYVGSSQRTGRFGTFPGNYVERI